MKNTAVDILGYKEGKMITRNDLQYRILLEQKTKACQAYLARLMRVKRAEYEETRKWTYTACRKKKRQVINWQLIAIEEELKERNLRWAHKMVQKIKEGYKPHTVQCKDMKGNIIDDKEQIRGRWKEHFEETLKHKNKTATIDIQQNQRMQWGSGNTGTNRA